MIEFTGTQGILGGPMVLELEICPKLPNGVKDDRKGEILVALEKMLTEGELFVGRESIKVEHSVIQGDLIHLKLKGPGSVKIG